MNVARISTWAKLRSELVKDWIINQATRWFSSSAEDRNRKRGEKARMRAREARNLRDVRSLPLLAQEKVKALCCEETRTFIAHCK